MAKLEEIIKERRLRWLGHVTTMEDWRIPNQALNWNRKPGRPRKNWQDIIRSDLKDIGLTWIKRVNWHIPEVAGVNV